MRYFVLACAASSLALAGCGKKDSTGNTSAVDRAVTAEDFATNDATAIDAATGADANMAADVDINLVDNAGNGGTPAAAPRSRPRAQASSNTSNSAEPATAPDEPAATESNAT